MHAKHLESIQRSHDILKQAFPNLKFEGFIMNLDGLHTKIDVIEDNSAFVQHELDHHTHIFHKDK